MLKKALIFVSSLAVLLMLALSYLTARFVDQEAIARAEQEFVEMRAMRDSIQFAVAIADSLQRLYEGQIAAQQREADLLRAEVARLEEARASAQLSVRRLRRPADLQERLAATFPEMSRSQWGIQEVFSDRGVGIEYLMVPLWFSETFIIDHQNALSYRAQRDTLMALDSLQTMVIALKDSVFQLEREKASAYKFGYDDAFAKYEALNEDYVTLLKQPPSVEVFPNKSAAVVSGLLGVVVGVAVTAVVK